MFLIHALVSIWWSHHWHMWQCHRTQASWDNQSCISDSLLSVNDDSSIYPQLSAWIPLHSSVAFPKSLLTNNRPKFEIFPVAFDGDSDVSAACRLQPNVFKINTKPFFFVPPEGSTYLSLNKLYHSLVPQACPERWPHNNRERERGWTFLSLSQVQTTRSRLSSVCLPLQMPAFKSLRECSIVMAGYGIKWVQLHHRLQLSAWHWSGIVWEGGGLGGRQGAE